MQEISAQSNSTIDSNIQKAVEELAELKKSVPLIADELFVLDKKQKEEGDGTLQESYREVRAEVVKVIQDLDRSSKEISVKLQEFSSILVQLSSTIKQLEQTQDHLQVGKKYLDQLLFLVYKLEREIYDEHGEQPDFLKLFIKSDNIPATLVGQDILESLLVQVKDLVNQASYQESEKKKHLDRITNLKVKAQQSIDQYITEIAKLQEKKEYLLNFMELYKEKQVLGITAQTSAFKVVNDEVLQLMDAIVKKNYQNKRQIDAALKTLREEEKSFSFTGSELAWPVYPVERVANVFNDPEYERAYGMKNNFLQLTVEQGSPVYAMHDGVVYHIVEKKNAINRIMILHSNGYVTSYAYLNNIAVKVGDLLKRGQFIGLSGGEPGTYGAGFVSEGQNLTFQIFKNGVALDPLTILDLSVVKDRSTVLPEEYRLKYFADHFERPIDVSSLQLMKGDTVDERAKNFLASYAVGPYKTLSFRDSVVVGTNIDRDMVICVAFAESTLGQYLSTDNNI